MDHREKHEPGEASATAGDSRVEAAAHCSKWNRGGSLLDLHTSERQEGDEGDAAGGEGGGGLVWYVKGERNNGLRERAVRRRRKWYGNSLFRQRSLAVAVAIGCAVPLSRIASRCSAVDVAIMRGAKGVGRSVGRSEWSALQISFDRRPRARQEHSRFR